MPRSRMALTSTLEVATSGDGESDQNHGEDGRKSRGEARPIEIDEGESIVGGGIVDFGIEDDFSAVLGVNGGTLGNTPGRVAVLAKVFLDVTFADSYLRANIEFRNKACTRGRYYSYTKLYFVLFVFIYVYSHMYCLLYTSPSPRDGLLSRMPSSA